MDVLALRFEIAGLVVEAMRMVRRLAGTQY